MAGIV